MRHALRWTVFTAGLTIVWLVGGFCYLVLSRHYAALQAPAAMLGALFLTSGVSAVAAIALAMKLDEEDEQSETDGPPAGFRDPPL